jgi:hypothetical protein
MLKDPGMGAKTKTKTKTKTIEHISKEPPENVFLAFICQIAIEQLYKLGIKWHWFSL